MDLKELFRELKGQGVTVSDIAEKIGKPYQTIYNYTKGLKKRPHPEILNSIASAYGYELSYDKNDNPDFTKKPDIKYELDQRSGQARENFENYLKWGNGDLELARFAEFVDKNNIPIEIIEDQIEAQEELAKILEDHKKINARLARVVKIVGKFDRLLGRYKNRNNDATK